MFNTFACRGRAPRVLRPRDQTVWGGDEHCGPLCRRMAWRHNRDGAWPRVPRVPTPVPRRLNCGVHTSARSQLAHSDTFTRERIQPRKHGAFGSAQECCRISAGSGSATSRAACAAARAVLSFCLSPDGARPGRGIGLFMRRTRWTCSSSATHSRDARPGRPDHPRVASSAASLEQLSPYYRGGLALMCPRGFDVRDDPY